MTDNIPVWLLCCLLLMTSCSVQSTSKTQEIPGRRPPATQKSYVINNKRYYPIPSAEGYNETGIASWYGGKFHGRKTSNGETYDMHAMTAAHKTLPMNTMLLIKNLDNGKSTVVRINDRGPFVQGRIIDLSFKAAQSLDIAQHGIARVQAVALGEQAVAGNGKPPTLVYQDLSVGEFYVQIGAFAVADNAVKLQKRFADSGHPTIIQKDFDGDLLVHRVQVYAGKTIQNAKRAEKALQERGWVGAFVVAR